MHCVLSELSRALTRDPAAEIARADAAFDAAIEQIARDIRANAEQRPIVLLSGPSGSGKTTTARKLEHWLDTAGLETHTLSLDDYFTPQTAAQRELAAAGKLDLESPDRVDGAFLHEQLESIIACRPTALPRFDFPTATREFSGRVLTRKPGEPVIVEGTHALNPAVTGLKPEQTTRLYVSVRSTLLTDDGTEIFPHTVRLMRRLQRDILFRGRPAADTLAMMPSVQRGERLHISPYKSLADREIDSLLPYELGVYRSLLPAVVETLPPDDPEVALLRRVLEAVPPIPPAAVPADSLIREFIGV